MGSGKNVNRKKPTYGKKKSNGKKLHGSANVGTVLYNFFDC